MKQSFLFLIAFHLKESQVLLYKKRRCDRFGMWSVQQKKNKSEKQLKCSFAFVLLFVLLFSHLCLTRPKHLPDSHSKLKKKEEDEEQSVIHASYFISTLYIHISNIRIVHNGSSSSSFIFFHHFQSSSSSSSFFHLLTLLVLFLISPASHHSF